MARRTKRRKSKSRGRRRGASGRFTRRRRGGRRSSRRRPASRRRRTTRRASRRRRPKFVTYRTLARRKGVRAAARQWRRRRKYVRSNPFTGLLPSMNEIMGVGKTALHAGAGWVGVNAVTYLADRLGLAKLKEGMSPGAQVAINTAVRLVATPIVAKLLARYARLDASKVAVGGALNVGIHAVQDLTRLNPGLIPAGIQPMLLGYDGHGDFIAMQGYGDFITAGSGVSGYLPSGGSIEDVETTY